VKLIRGLNRVANVLSPNKRAYANIPPVRLADVMTQEIVSVSPGQTFGEVIGLMANRPFRHVLVIREDGRLAGVISDRDLLRKIAVTKDWKSKLVEEVMTRDVLTVRAETTISAAVREIIGRRINCLPVLDKNEKVCGIVTSTDLLRAFEILQAALEKLAG